MARSMARVGIDEVGRGALAGPVTVAAVLAPSDLRPLTATGPTVLRDSKRLTPRARVAWLRHIRLVARRNPGVRYAVASVAPRVIDQVNITKAANRAASRAFAKLVRAHGTSVRNAPVFLDGGLYLSRRTLRSVGYRGIPKTVPHGDERIGVIQLASIVAKVQRDRWMLHLHRRHPRYGFAIHKGYGTRAHRAVIHRYGRSPIHRQTFAVHR